jgi:hypothetical protein
MASPMRDATVYLEVYTHPVSLYSIMELNKSSSSSEDGSNSGLGLPKFGCDDAVTRRMFF